MCLMRLRGGSEDLSCSCKLSHRKLTISQIACRVHVESTCTNSVGVTRGVLFSVALPERVPFPVSLSHHECMLCRSGFVCVCPRQSLRRSRRA